MARIHSLRRLLAIGALSALTAVAVDSRAPLWAASLRPLITASDSSGNVQPLGIQEADVSVTLHGPLAKTIVTLTFRNNTARVLEGDLDFPLPEGAALSGYALDINGEMAEAVPVPKQQARVIFEAENRRRVDPGLVEQTEGNNFRTRLYPIPAHGTRTIRIESVSQAAPDARGGLRVLIPMHWNQTVPRIRLSLQADAPLQGSLGNLYRDMIPGGTRRTHVMENAPTNGDLGIAVDDSKSPAWTTGAIVEPFTKASGITDWYVAVTGAVQMPIANQLRRGQDHHVGLIWDASLSRRGANVPREMTLLQSIATARWRDTTVDVTVFRDRVEPVKSFPIRNGDVSALVAYLRAQPIDGGTDLTALPLSHVASGHNRCDYNLLFTDGLDTLGSALSTPAGGAPVFAVASDSRGDLTGLRYLANRTGGDLIDLTTDVRSTAQIATSIGMRPLAITAVHVDAGDVRDLTPSGIVPISTSGSEITVAGRLLSSTARLTLHYGYSGGPEVATRIVTLRKVDAPAVSAGLVGALWAQKRADALAAAPEANRDALISLGRDYNIVTPGTSLLVLDTLDQHLRYGIAPARSRKALYAAYVRAVEATGLTRANNERDQLGFAISRWRARLEWWAKTYTYPRSIHQGGRSPSHIIVRAMGSGGADISLADESSVRVSGGNPGSNTGSASFRTQSLEAPAVRQQYASSNGASAPAEMVLPSAVLTAAGGASHIVTLNMAKADASKGGGDDAPTIAVAIKEWTPDAPCLKSLAAARSATDAYGAYLRERIHWVDAPSFYFDCAENLHRRGADDLAVRVLTSIDDLQLEEPALLRIVAYRLNEWGYRNRAIGLFEKVARLRPDEPQSFRDLALVLELRGDAEIRTDPRRAVADYNRALQLLNRVAIGHWDRFEAITDVAVNEANDILVHAKRLPASAQAKLVVPLDRRLIKDMDCDLRVVMTWDSDNTDMDLHVIEPSHEECYYAHNRTAIGGRLSDDFTQGYGPEEYLVRHGMHGTYAVRSNYFGSSEQRLSGGTTVQATVYTDWGRPTEKRQSMTLRLTKDKETVTIGNVVVGNQH